jgi:hypothetical protein
MVGSKRPQPHRIHLSTGRVLVGNLHRAPNIRLADHLTTLKGFLSMTDAACTASGERFDYVVLNLDHVLFIEEVVPRAEATGAAVGIGSLAG